MFSTEVSGGFSRPIEGYVSLVFIRIIIQAGYVFLGGLLDSERFRIM
jgi:hypothetical protein